MKALLPVCMMNTPALMTAIISAKVSIQRSDYWIPAFADMMVKTDNFLIDRIAAKH